MNEEILVSLIVFSTIFGVAYVYLTTRNKERLALIEKGADATLFNSGKRKGLGSIVLNLALLAIGVGVGVLVGAGFEQGGMDGDVSYPASIFIFAGIGLVASFFINRKLDQE